MNENYQIINVEENKILVKAKLILVIKDEMKYILGDRNPIILNAFNSKENYVV